ncbi:MAG: hypothetical protein E6J90_50925 [Deltaproteobacteria bacterium]|nr:MAG: hypothetical protein E6J90_50925 [Deltaproteobacteria bacterium]TMQ10213.1 MAG: hypothetical protein E6J91_27540 [Deltaproteobacteria bacterium]
MATRCTHNAFRYDWGRIDGMDVAIAKWCLACGERMPLGPANDDHGAGRVAIELRAASMDYGDSVPWTDDELRGWDMHCAGEDATPANDGEECGYLARELATHDDRDDRDAEAWPWGVTRPIAEQPPVATESMVGSEPKDADPAEGTEHADRGDKRTRDHALDHGGAA